MQGVVFTYRRRRTQAPRKKPFKAAEFKKILKNWGVLAFLAVSLVCGLAFGCLTAGGLSEESLKKLDFLFATNLPDRLIGGGLNAFFAGFGSDFIFLFAAFLSGLSLWGAFSAPIIAFFKGCGIGVSAGYLLITYGLKGIIFYLAVLLPGITVFSIALLYELNCACNMFRHLIALLLKKSGADFKKFFISYLKSGLKYLIITFCASVIDAVLWICLAGLFF